MKKLKIILAVMVLGAIIASLAGCSSKTNSGAAKTQTIAVKRGNLELDITAAGNLNFTQTQDLPVSLFYQSGSSGRGGTVGQVFVEVGDTVKKDQVLISIDKGEWDDQLSTLQDAVTSQERNLFQAQINEKTAEQALKTSQDLVSTKEVTMLNAEITLEQAQNSLATSISAIDYNSALSALRKAQTWYDYVLTTYKSLNPDIDDYTMTVQNAQDNLTVAQTNYDNVLTGYNSEEVNMKKQQVEVAEKNLALAQGDINDANIDITVKQQSLTLSQERVSDAQHALDLANKNLSDAQGKSPDITAPFDGFVTAVNVKSGDSVYNGTIAVTVADPTKYEADIYVSEMDISKVKIGGGATVSVSAFPGIMLPAKVTYIAPTATIQSGVVNYSVKVAIDSPSLSSQKQAAGQPTSGNVTADNLPTRLQQAVDSGRLTQQQAEALLNSGATGNFTPPANFAPPAGAASPGGSAFSGTFGDQTRSQLPSSSTTGQNVQLKQGLTVTVNIIYDSRTNVLLVPNAAVTRSGGQSTVEVITASGTTEKRTVTTGISDWQYTEIASGLNEGDQISVPVGTATVTTSSSSQRGGGIPFLGPGR